MEDISFIMKNKLAIIILNYNSWGDTVQCIESIYKTTFVPDEFNIYVVDNKSTKVPDDKVRQKFSEYTIKYIQAECNRGYAAGNNLGIKCALEDECTHFLICNSDVIFVSDDILKMYNYLNENENVGIVGPCVFDSNDEFHWFYFVQKADFKARIKHMFLKTPFKGFFRKFKENYTIKSPITVPRKMFSVSGCCFMMSEKCTRYLYPLDENTFLYEEENIIGCRLENTEFEAHILPNTHVIHLEGQSTKGMSEFSKKCAISSEQYFLKEYLNTNFLCRKILRLIRWLSLGV